MFIECAGTAWFFYSPCFGFMTMTNDGTGLGFNGNQFMISTNEQLTTWGLGRGLNTNRFGAAPRTSFQTLMSAPHSLAKREICKKNLCRVCKECRGKE